RKAFAKSMGSQRNRLSRDAGFTLIEMLIAGFVFALIMGALTAYFVNSTRGNRAMETVSNRQQELEAAVNVMTYDVALAGYKGTTPDEVAREFANPSLVVTKASGPNNSDRLQIRYFEDSHRLFGADETCGSPCLVTYEVAEDAGTVNLYRQEGSDPEKGIVQEVEHFKVIQYILRDGSQLDVTSATPVPSNLAALNIEIAFATGGLWRFPVGLNN